MIFCRETPKTCYLYILNLQLFNCIQDFTAKNAVRLEALLEILSLKTLSLPHSFCSSIYTVQKCTAVVYSHSHNMWSPQYLIYLGINSNKTHTVSVCWKLPQKSIVYRWLYTLIPKYSCTEYGTHAVSLFEWWMMKELQTLLGEFLYWVLQRDVSLPFFGSTCRKWSHRFCCLGSRPERNCWYQWSWRCICGR